MHDAPWHGMARLGNSKFPNSDPVLASAAETRVQTGSRYTETRGRIALRRLLYRTYYLIEGILVQAKGERREEVPPRGYYHLGGVYRTREKAGPSAVRGERRRYGAGQWYLFMIAIELALALGIGLFDEVQMSQKVVVVPPGGRRCT